MVGIGAAFRANIATDLQTGFLNPIDPAHSAEMLAQILGVPFLGFAFTIAIGSPLLDYIGMRLLLPLSAVSFIVGLLLMLFAGQHLQRAAASTRRSGPARSSRASAGVWSRRSSILSSRRSIPPTRRPSSICSMPGGRAVW